MRLSSARPGIGILVGGLGAFLLTALGACTTPPDVPPQVTRCNESRDCPEGQYCELGSCIDGDAPDGRIAGDGGGGDALEPAGDDAGGDTATGDSWVAPPCECPGIQDCPVDTGTCVEPVLCLEDLDCTAPNVCVTGVCSAVPACRDNIDCGGGVCDMGSDGTIQCCAGFECPECAGAGDCPGLQGCDVDTCVSPSICVDDTDCLGTRICEPRCDAVDSSGCSGAPVDCGNDLVEGTEVCDGGDLDSHGCFDQGFTSGVLVCQPSCNGFDTSGCSDVVCGNNVLDGNEVCDGAQLGAATCATEGLGGGTLGCLPGCDGFDYSLCDQAPSCGDNIAGPGEKCDGTDPGILTCADLGFTGGGTVACGLESCALPAACIDDISDDRATAELLTLTDGFYAGAFELCSTDSDWFTVDVSRGDTIVVRAKYDRRIGSLRAEYYIDDELDPVSVDDSAFGYLIFGVENIDGTQVQFRFEELGIDEDRGDRLAVELEVMVTSACRDDTLEPNDDDTNPTVGAVDDSFTFNTCRVDEDWFSIPVPSAMTLRASLDTLTGDPMTVEVFQNSPIARVLFDAMPDPTKVLEHQNTQLGTATYYLRIYNAPGETRAEGVLTLEVVDP